MPRTTMGLTLEDLRILSQIIKIDSKSMSDAANIVNVDRARLTRLIGRVNAQIGEDLEWRENGRFCPPPEARRIAWSFDQFDSELTEMASSPRVSAGASASLVLLAFLQIQKHVVSRFSMIRSRHVLEALMRDEIDVALIHRESLNLQLNLEKQIAMSEIETTSLLEWQAKVIRPKKNLQDSGVPQGIISWEVGSMGEKLSHILNPSDYLSDNGLYVRCRSFVECIELVRRGLVGQAVVPDIYLRSAEVDLDTIEPDKPLRGDLIALYRVSERSRWSWLLNKQSWQEAKDQRFQARP